ncbi:flagellar motor protein MotB [Roseobacter sp. HKCCA0434]|uniref:flagellar motor protein MotB n=1 Tax=Roseobacter sp. HKCCA0434 TaxID=3079297 RepID=UPI002905D988|nr:flagellar motor protein MotB [Roseobacter sp. HKCCA0434]
MPSRKSNERPIIVKRRRAIAVHSHHGGAWKVAYADFVTAMMAFFLLMWLLNATDEDQRMAIASYFTPAISISQTSGGGDGALGGDSIFTEEVLPQDGTGATDVSPTDRAAASGDDATDTVADSSAGREAMVEMLDAAIAADPDLAHMLDFRASDEGLIIDITGRPEARLFAEGDASPSPALQRVLRVFSEILPIVANDISIAAYRDADPRSTLGARRAQGVAAALWNAGVEPTQIARVTGLALAAAPAGIPSREDDAVTVTFLRL